MSRENLKDFFYSAERSSKLRERIQQCKEDQDKILDLAQEYGFTITIEDLAQDDDALRIENWFKTSKLSPLNNNQ